MEEGLTTAIVKLIYDCSEIGFIIAVIVGNFKHLPSPIPQVSRYRCIFVRRHNEDHMVSHLDRVDALLLKDDIGLGESSFDNA